MFQIVFGRLHFLAQQLQRFQRIVQPLAALAQPVLHQNIAILGFKLVVIQCFGVHLNRAGAFFIDQLLEQILVIHDEADEQRAGQQRFHGFVQLAALRAVAFIDKNKQFAGGMARLALQLLDESVKVVDIAFDELVH